MNNGIGPFKKRENPFATKAVTTSTEREKYTATMDKELRRECYCLCNEGNPTFSVH